MFEIITERGLGKTIKEINRAFEMKEDLEKQIATLIREYEDTSGLAIDMIHYQRDITLPIRSSRYTSLNIIINQDVDGVVG